MICQLTKSLFDISEGNFFKFIVFSDNQISYHMSELLKDKQIKTKGNKCCEVTLSVRYILSIFLHSKKITFNLRVAVPSLPPRRNGRGSP